MGFAGPKFSWLEHLLVTAAVALQKDFRLQHSSLIILLNIAGDRKVS